MPSPANTEPKLSDTDSWGWMNGRWQPLSQLALPLSDLGVRQAVTVVERLRTYNGNVLGLPRHLDRLTAAVSAIGIEDLPMKDEWTSLIADLLQRNAAMLDRQGDLSITILATPGSGDGSTAILHVGAIDHLLMKRRRTDGQPLVLTDVVQPSSASWPRQWKVRCRMHYFLADRIAQGRHPGATGALIDDDGSVTETSIANLAIVEAGRIVSPPKSQVLGGVTQSFIEPIAADQHIAWSHERLMPDRIKQADEILLMGTDGGIWWGWLTEEHSQQVDAVSPGPVFIKLRQAFDQHIAELVS